MRQQLRLQADVIMAGEHPGRATVQIRVQQHSTAQHRRTQQPSPSSSRCPPGLCWGSRQHAGAAGPKHLTGQARVQGAQEGSQAAVKAEPGDSAARPAGERPAQGGPAGTQRRLVRAHP